MEIRLIGCGAMGSAIAQTLAESGSELSLYDKHEERAESLARAIGSSKVNSPLEGIEYGDALVLAVKPQDFDKAAEEIKEIDGALVASIVTGISIDRLKAAFPRCSVLRMMPNLAVRYGDGVVVLADDPSLLPFKEKIEEIFSPLGKLIWIQEDNLEGATALTGSGPAFVFAMIESMVEAAIAMGFSHDVGYELVKQMVGGALTMLYESPEHPSDLRWRVCSPAGTTIAGLRVLEERGLRSAIVETFLASYKRAQELKIV